MAAQELVDSATFGNGPLTLCCPNHGGGVALLLRFNREEREIMGAILPFVPRAAVTKTAQPTDIVAAAIIIFPGVRYERRDTSDDGAGRAKAGVSKGSKPGPARH
jgi:hypothetical protein